MNRRTFLLGSTVGSVSCALPVGLGLVTGPALSAVVAQDLGEPLTALSSANEALFRLHNWETEAEHRALAEDSAPLISLSANWKATWL
ncbi:MAG: hypothetical protein WCK56_10735 [Alcaligenaceae bacterium]